MKKQVHMQVRKPSLRNIGGITLPSPPARPPVDEEAMHAFIMKPPPGEALFAAHEIAPTADEVLAHMPPTAEVLQRAMANKRIRKHSTSRRRADTAVSGEGLARVTVHLPEEMDEALRIACVRHKMSMSHAVEKAIAQYLATL